MPLGRSHQHILDTHRPPNSGPRRGTALDVREAPGQKGCATTTPGAFEALDTGEMVGAVSSNQADPQAGRFEYGVTVGAGHRRKRYAAEAVVMLLRFMFAERRYHKCEARVFAHNQGSLALHHRLGFVEEGRLRDHVFLAGRHHDLVLLGILADEFARLHPPTEPPLDTQATRSCPR
ncbi:GNAT family N-acetyltransferase [Streptomyces sp. NPDC057199]|uniref:GNAT family N-acetyltransferase n=1 Tax=Streptomyces sp. NPDC057199 TaxID=3346047 RepID=UPI00363AD05A